MADHHFSVEIAVEYGVNAAILFQNIHFWCEKNRANGMNLHDGLYWTYNSRKAFRELFPYMSEKQIKAALDKLIENGLITTGTYNEDARDRTLWYAVTKKGDCIFQNGNMEISERANANAEKDAPLPYIKQTDINTDRKTDREEVVEESACACEGNPFGEDDGGRPDPNTVELYASGNIQYMSPTAMEELVSFRDSLDDEVIRHGIDVACDNGKRVWSYVRAILNRYVQDGARNIGAALASDERNRKQHGSPPQRRGAIDRENNKVPLPYGGGEIV